MSNAIVPTRDRLSGLRTLFEKSKPSIAAVLPKHLSPEKILKITLSAASRTPRLLDCTSESILLAVMQCAQLGLEPNTPLGLAYLIPYKNRKKDGNGRWVEVMEAQFIPGYRGLIKLAHQSGEIASVRSRVVRAGDEFEVAFGSDEHIAHRPNLAAEGEDAELIAVYAVATFKEGAAQFEVMSRAQVDAIRARSRAADSGPWVSDYEEMARKTVLRRLCKSLPLSTELATALEAQARAESGEGPDFGDIREVLPAASEATAATATDKVRGALADKAAKARAENSDDHGDDDPPPTGTDGGGARDAGGEGADAEGFAAHQARTAGGPQASVRVVREYSDEELVASAKAWDGYLAGCNAWKARNAFRKLSGAFNAEGVFSARERAVVAHLERLPDVKNARAFLYAQPAQKEVDKAA